MNKLLSDVGFGLGVAACNRKARRAPCLDKQVMSIIETECGKDPKYRCTDLLKGWHAGYEWQIDQDLKASGI